MREWHPKWPRVSFMAQFCPAKFDWVLSTSALNPPIGSRANSVVWPAELKMTAFKYTCIHTLKFPTIFST